MKIVFFFFFFITLSSVTQIDNTIDIQINQIMQAPVSERLTLMNELKTKIAVMNSNERNEALQKLSGNMDINMHSGTMDKGSIIKNRSSFMPVRHQMNTIHQHSQSKRH